MSSAKSAWLSATSSPLWCSPTTHERMRRPSRISGSARRSRSSSLSAYGRSNSTQTITEPSSVQRTAISSRLIPCGFRAFWIANDRAPSNCCLSSFDSSDCSLPLPALSDEFDS
eukprot:5158656-Prymnesium_polylepis.1